MASFEIQLSSWQHGLTFTKDWNHAGRLVKADASISKISFDYQGQAHRLVRSDDNKGWENRPITIMHYADREPDVLTSLTAVNPTVRDQLTQCGIVLVH